MNTITTDCGHTNHGTNRIEFATSTDTRWVKGRFTAGCGTQGAGSLGRTYWFEALVFDTPSDYGIDCGGTGEGRVSKLHVCYGERWNHTLLVFSYDRDYDLVPDTDSTEYLDTLALVRMLEVTPVA